MMPGNRAKSVERQLRNLFTALDDDDQATLLAFAEFLATRHKEQAPAELPEPTSIPRPEKESVVGAIKRLSATYPMLDKGRMLNETSNLMTQHIMHGRAATDVIDELEVFFRQQYEQFKEEFRRG